MNIGDIAERFIRAAEVERAMPGRVGPAPVRSMPLPYVHDWVDKLGWSKTKGDKLKEDPLQEERRLFWERLGLQASAAELSQLEALREWLLIIEDEGQRRALLAWSMAKAGGRSFRKWCFKIEGIHPNTGRNRKNRALDRISAHLNRCVVQNSDNDHSDGLLLTPEIGNVSAILEDDAPVEQRSFSWRDDPSFRPFDDPTVRDFSWAQKRSKHRREREARKRKEAQKAA